MQDESKSEFHLATDGDDTWSGTLAAPGSARPDELWGCTADGETTFAVRENGQLTVGGAFKARWADTPIGRMEGEGFLHVTPRSVKP